MVSASTSQSHMKVQSTNSHHACIIICFITDLALAMSAHLIVGLFTKLAIRAGYHRDSSRFPDLTPFEGEMRRRIWTFIYDVDLMASFQNGVPRGIIDSQCDAQVPSNLRDEDFDEFTSILPPSRPSSVVTATNHLISKHKICQCMAKIMDRSHDTTEMQYSEVMALDFELNDVYKSIPVELHKVGPMPSDEDRRMVWLWRHFLAMLYQKARCVLHRRFFCASSEEQRHPHSRAVCIDAAMSILTYQRDAYEQSQPGGIFQLQGDAWKCSSLEMHDVILATPLLCFDLSRSSGRHNSVDSSSGSDMLEDDAALRQRQIDAMESSLAIWRQARDESVENQQAVKIIEALVRRATMPNAATGSVITKEESNGQGFQSDSAYFGAQSVSQMDNTAMPSFEIGQATQAAQYSGFGPQFSNPMSPSNQFGDGLSTNVNDPFLDTFGNLNEQNYNIDWVSYS